MKGVALLVLAAGVFGCTGGEARSGHGSAQSSPPPAHFESLRRTYHLKDLQRVTLEANGHAIPAWVMDDEAKRQEGMMWLEEADVRDEDGMIFVFPQVQPKCAFWMENTVLALDIIFISPAKKVLNIQRGRPFDRSSLPAAGPTLYVLEMKQGSAERLGIKAGTAVKIPSDLVGK